MWKEIKKMVCICDICEVIIDPDDKDEKSGFLLWRGCRDEEETEIDLCEDCFFEITSRLKARIRTRRAAPNIAIGGPESDKYLRSDLVRNPNTVDEE